MSNPRILELVKHAESALREPPHRPDLDPTSRAHLERALMHALEANIAVQELAKARSVQELVGDLEKVDRLLAKLRHLRDQSVVSKSVGV